MSKSLVLWPCFGLLVAFLGKYLMDFGVFRQIENKGLDQCRLIVPTDGEYQAFEDFAIDYEKGVAYMPADNRIWLHAFNLKDQVNNKRGTVFMFDIQSETFRKFDLIDYPYEHFHPLGISLLKRQKNHLFMTNFRTDSDGNTLGSVEIFEIDASNPNELKWIDSVVDPFFTIPDDVFAIDEKTFYVTNIYYYSNARSAFMHTVEILTKRPWGNLLLCSKGIEWQCSMIDDSMMTANGIAASLDLQTIYVASTSEKRVRVYERHSDDNSLTYQYSLYVPFLIDNVIVNEKDQLIAAGHPKAIAFLMHEKYPRKYPAPSEVVIFPNPKSNSTYEQLLVTNGEFLSASTVAATYKGKVLVGALIDHGILLCQNLLDRQ